MKQRIVLFLSSFVTWTIFFLIARALFLLYHANLTAELSFTDILLVFAYGLRMDLSMAGYLSLIPGLMLAFTFFTTGKRLSPFWLAYHAIVLFITGFIIVLDFEL